MEYSAKGIVHGKTELLKDFYPLLYALCPLPFAALQDIAQSPINHHAEND